MIQNTPYFGRIFAGSLHMALQKSVILLQYYLKGVFFGCSKDYSSKIHGFVTCF